MIKSCEDVKTLNDFFTFSEFWRKAKEMGLKETIEMISWDERHLICPKLFTALSESFE